MKLAQLVDEVRQELNKVEGAARDDLNRALSALEHLEAVVRELVAHVPPAKPVAKLPHAEKAKESASKD